MMRVIACALCVTAAAFAAESPEIVTFTSTTRLVIVNVTVKDRAGRTTDHFGKEDFLVFEDGVEQRLAFCEFQRLDRDPQPPRAAERQPAEAAPASHWIRHKDRRLIVLFFDLSAMPPEDVMRAQRGARKFIHAWMEPQDLVAVITFGVRLRLVQDFTSDKDLLHKAVAEIRVGETSALASELGEGFLESRPDAGAAFDPDDAEFQLFNTDRRLSAIEEAIRLVAALPEKKAFVHFSSGVGKTGIENLAQLRATANAAVRANVSLFPVDARGLAALPPGGDASRPAPKGAALFSGQAQFGLMDSLRAQQQTLYSLAAETGGRALLDSNDLSEGIRFAQRAIESYYVLGYYSSNPAEDGRFRRVQVRLRKPQGFRLDHRAGYFAPKRFEKMSGAGKERQLEEALLSGDPVQELPLALEVNSFRLGSKRYFAAVAVKIPRSALPTARGDATGVVALDFIGQVRDARGMLASAVRDAITVRFDPTARGRGHLQYDTGFTLEPGAYRLRFVVRENLSGRIGTFETALRVPERWPEREWISLSSVVWSSQREPLAAAAGRADANRNRAALHPLVRDGAKLIPSVTRVFRRDQTLIAYAEIYGPSVSSDHPQPSVSAVVNLYRDGQLVCESEPAAVREHAARRGSAALEVQLSLQDLPAGRYTAQFHVVDHIARSFLQRRAAIVIVD